MRESYTFADTPAYRAYPGSSQARPIGSYGGHGLWSSLTALPSRLHPLYPELTEREQADGRRRADAHAERQAPCRRARSAAAWSSPPPSVS
jgi:hypothetical protein